MPESNSADDDGEESSCDEVLSSLIGKLFLILTTILVIISSTILSIIPELDLSSESSLLLINLFFSVTVCGEESSLVHSTVSPTLILMGFGWYAVLVNLDASDTIDICVVLESCAETKIAILSINPRSSTNNPIADRALTIANSFSVLISIFIFISTSNLLFVSSHFQMRYVHLFIVGV